MASSRKANFGSGIVVHNGSFVNAERMDSISRTTLADNNSSVLGMEAGASLNKFERRAVSRP